MFIVEFVVVVAVGVATSTCVGTNRCDASIDWQLAGFSQQAQESRVDAPSGNISLKVVSQILLQQQRPNMPEEYASKTSKSQQQL